MQILLSYIYKLYNKVKTLYKKRKLENRGKRVYIINLVTQLTHIRGRIGFRLQSQQNLVEFSKLSRIRQNMAEYSGKRQIAVDCGSLVVGLWLLSRQKQVDIYKVLQECPVTISRYIIIRIFLQIQPYRLQSSRLITKSIAIFAYYYIGTSRGYSSPQYFILKALAHL